LKALPPVVDTKAAREAGIEAWWNDTKEIERVLRMYRASSSLFHREQHK
jgi:hypothetical protein